MFAERSGGLSVQETEWLVQVKQNFRHLNSLGIIHNYINPSNTMFEKDKLVVIDLVHVVSKGLMLVRSEGHLVARRESDNCTVE